MNNFTVKSAAHDVDIGKNSDDLRKLERQRAEENVTTDGAIVAISAVDTATVKSIVPVSLGCHHLLSAIVEKTSSFYQLPSVLSVPTNNCTEDNQRHKQDVDGIYEVRRELQLAGFVASGWAPFGMPGA